MNIEKRSDAEIEWAKRFYSAPNAGPTEEMIEAILESIDITFGTDAVKDEGPLTAEEKQAQGGLSC